MKNNNGISTSSPARSFCSSKQKHSTFEKYAAAWRVSQRVSVDSERKSEEIGECMKKDAQEGRTDKKLTLSGATLYVAIPTISSSLLFLAV